MINTIKNSLYNSLFKPSFLGIFINVFYLDRTEIYKSIKRLSKHVKGRVLDVGCSNKPYEDLFTVESYIGLEIDSVTNRLNKKADFFYDGNSFPFKQESFDTILTSQVLEHVFNPDKFLNNINRVLVNGGVLIISVPFMGDEHEKPYDYGRYTSFGLKHLLEKHGFEVIEQYKTTVGFGAIIQLTVSYFYKYTISLPVILRWGIQIILCILFNPLGIVLGIILPKNEDFFLGNTVYAKKRV